ncbi:hypothetical protein [Microbacterium kyungheense]|uniref:hypothetical protein n=1 Tax=Microbacterium kyungheense TaxID=1263636 RepID=UPI0011547974|nr:hypothetical protein [Microbacterium kyungheense]
MPDSGIDAVRVGLLREIAREGRRDAGPRRRRTVRWIGGSALAGGVAAALVVGMVMVPATAPTASAAQTVLEKAAVAGIRAAATPVPAGSYTRVETAFTWATTYDEQMPAGAEFNNAHRQDADAVLLIQDESSVYVPADSGGDWVRERDPYRVADAAGPLSSVATGAWEREMAPATAGLAGVTRYPGGIVEGGRDGDAVTYHLDGRETFADMPADPDGVVEWFEERYGAEGESDGIAHFFIETLGDLMSFNLASADARAGMLRAFASLPGVEVVSADGALTTLSYEQHFEAGAARVEFVLDTARGYILQSTHWGMGEYDEPVAFEGMPDWQTRTVSTVSVVDSAPSPSP